MRTMWTKIGLGALGIFVVGMLVITVAREAQSAVSSAVHEVVTTGVERAAAFHESGDLHGLSALASRHSGHLDMVFRLDGERVGSVDRLVVRREARGDLADFNLTVTLDEASSLARLIRCDITPADTGDFDLDGGFRCLDRGEGPTVQAGTVRFEPGGLVRPIRVAARLESKLREGNAFQADIGGNGQVEVKASGDRGSLVSIQAGEAGAHIRVNDELGRSLFRLLADSNGASMRVRGKDGRDIVRMAAGEGGFSLEVDTAAAAAQ